MNQSEKIYGGSGVSLYAIDDGAGHFYNIMQKTDALKEAKASYHRLRHQGLHPALYMWSTEENCYLKQETPEGWNR